MQEAKYGFLGVVAGAIALLLALTHFWAGPFSPQPTVESYVAQKASSIRSAALDALTGKEPIKETYLTKWDTDKIVGVATALLGGIALILAVISFTQREPIRVVSGAAALGGGAIAFQFIAMYAMLLLVIILICAALSSLGVG